ncbi:MAG: amidase [Pseudomonadota bacterium]
MTPDEYAELDATELALLVQKRDLKSEDILSAARQRAQYWDTGLNFVASLNDAPSELAASHCIPTFFKDLGSHCPSFPFWNGCKLFDGERAPALSNFGRSLIDAGTVPIGVSTAPEFSLEGHTQSELFGKTRNPWDPSRSPGGSSGGAAVAVATGSVPVAHASDIAGSIRLPAAWCGIVGLKPSRGRGSIGPVREEAGFGLANNFVVTRSVRDTAFFLDALSRHFPGDPFELSMPEGGFRAAMNARDPGRLKIAMTLPEPQDGPDAAEIAMAVERVASALEAEGHVIVPVAKPGATPDPEAMIALVTVWHAGFAAQMDQVAARLGRKVDSSTMGPTAFAAYEYSKTIGLDGFLAARHQIFTMRREMGTTLRDYDLWLTPTSAKLPTPWNEVAPIGPGQSLVDHAVEKMFPLFEFTFGHNICGTPAISLPLGQATNGLPIGVQIGAKFGREDDLLRVSKLLESSELWSHARPQNLPEFSDA